MKKIKIQDKEYNCSNRIYFYIKGLEENVKYLKIEISKLKGRKDV